MRESRFSDPLPAGFLEHADAAAGQVLADAVGSNSEDATKVLAPRPLEQKELADVPAATVEEVKAMLDSGTPVQIIDTRPKHYSTRAQEIMAGAVTGPFAAFQPKCPPAM